MEVLPIISTCLSYLNLLRSHKQYRERKKKFRRWWVQQHLRKAVRDRFGLYSTQFFYFRDNNEEQFLKMMGMTHQQFDELHSILQDKIEKCAIRRTPLPSELRLALTLYYLSHGDSLQSVARLFYVGVSTAYQIISEVCTHIWNVLVLKHIAMKSEQDWKNIADEYLQQWGFPNCVGAIDGKHIRILKPPRSGSLFFNYKKYYSFVLMAICDARYRFSWVDVRDYGSMSDNSIFGATKFHELLVNKRANLPAACTLPNSEVVVPFSFIGDAIFTLSTFLMRPFPRRLITSRKEDLYNYRHSRARMTIENTFGIWSAMFRVLRQPLAFNLSTNIAIVKATLCLHNFLINNESQLKPEDRKYVTDTFVDKVGEDGTVIGGEWRKITREDEEDANYDEENAVADGEYLIQKNDSSAAAIIQRNNLANYFVKEEGFVFD